MKKIMLFALFAAAMFCTKTFAGQKPVVSLDDINQKGYISRWLAAGKFSPGVPGGFTSMIISRKVSLTQTDYLTDHGGESGIEPEEGMEHKRGESSSVWKTVETKGGLLDLADAMGKSGECVMYAAAYISSDHPAWLLLDMQSLSGAAVFANHKLVYRSPSGVLGESGNDKVQIQLNKGTNLILIKFGGLRYEKAASLLNVPMADVRETLRSMVPALSDSSGMSIFVQASPLAQVGNTPVFVQTNITPTGYFQGTAKSPKMEIGILLANNSDIPADDISIKVSAGAAAGTATVSIDPRSYKSARVGIPITKKLEGHSLNVTVNVSYSGKSLKMLPVSMTVPTGAPKREQAVFLIPGSHADPTWIEDQRDYGAVNIDDLRQNMLLCTSDPGYGVYFSEIDSLKPFYDIYPEYRATLKDLIAQRRIGLGGAYNQPIEKLISGEAFVRNIIYGKMFHKKVLGGNPTVYMGWDIFGHVPQLSQIIAKTGGVGTMWSKAVWGFPPVFNHMALDGTTVLHKRLMYGMWLSGVDDLRSFTYGYLKEMNTYGVDYDVRLDCNDFKPPTPWVPGETKYLRSLLPSVDVTGSGGDKFFEKVIGEEKQGLAHIPVTSRDMAYYHQGTALSRESLKNGNRFAENSLITAEKFATIASLFGAKYPDLALDKAWRQLLFGEHHDALTGTINDRTYIDLMQGYREAAELSTQVIDKSLDYIGGNINTTPPKGSAKILTTIAVFNPLNWDRTDVARAIIDFTAAAPGGFTITDAGGGPVPFEIEGTDATIDGGILDARIIFIADKVPQMGYSLFYVIAADKYPEQASRTVIASNVIKNNFYTIEVDPARGGGIVSLRDNIAGKEVINLKNGVGNDLAALAENPNRNEPPWEVYTIDKRSFSSEAAATVTVTTGPVSQRIRIDGTIGKTKTVKEIVLYNKVRRIDMLTKLIDYKGQDEMFVATFPVAVENAVPVFEDRYGAIVRKKSRGKLDFKTWQMNNFSGNFAYAAYQWLDQSNSGLVEFKGAGHAASASFALGMMGIITDHSATAQKASEILITSFVKKGILSTPWYDDGDKSRVQSLSATDSTMPKDMNFDLSYGTSFRVSLNSGGDNLYTKQALSKLDASKVAAFNKKVEADGYAYLLVYDPDSPKDWPPVPVLIIKAKNDEKLIDAVKKLAKDFDSDATITLPDDANATGASPKVEDYGVALLNKGSVMNSVENDGTMAVALMHTASFFRKLPFAIIPEDRTAVFPYALLPHAGNWRAADIHRAGYEYNNPLIARQLDAHNGTLPSADTSFLKVQPDNIIVTALKPRGNPEAAMQSAPSDPAKAITLRLYEARGDSAQAKISFFTGIKKAESTDMLEDRSIAPMKLSAGALQDAVTPFSIRTYTFTPAKPPHRSKPASLGAEIEPFSPIYTRYWMHNDGAAPMGNLPVSIGIRGNVKTKAVIEKGGVTINELEVFVTNDYIDRSVTGKVHIEVPRDWKVMPGSFTYELKPGAQVTKKVILAFLGQGRDGIVKVRTEFGGQTLQDVLEVGEHKLDISAVHNSDNDTYMVTVKNPNNQSIEGELYLVTPQETWGERSAPDFALAEVTPRMTGFSVPAQDQQTFEFRLTRTGSDVPLSNWAVVKCVYNGRVFYLKIE